MAGSMSQQIPRSRVRQGEILAGMINDGDCASQGVETLTSRHFTQPKAKRMFEAISSLVSDGADINLAAVAERVEGVSMSEVADVAAINVTGTQFKYLLARHVEDYQREDTILALNNAARSLGDVEGRAEVERVLSAMHGDIGRILEDGQRDALTPEAIAEREITRLVEHGPAVRWRLSGERLNSLTGGFGAGEFVVLAARPSVGKTTMSLNWANWFARTGASVVFLSLEMSAWEITRSLIRIAGNRPVPRDADPCQLRTASESIRGLNIRIEEASGATGQSVAARVRRLNRQRKVDVVIVDYLQRLRGDSGKGNRYEDMTNISNDLADLAHGTGITVVALAQLNRGVEQRGDHKPKMSDLRESGAIEQDADQIMLLSRANQSNGARCMDMEVVSVDLAKNRTGATGVVDHVFHKATGVFSEIE